MFPSLDISVIIATHNRAEMLRQTLEGMAKLNMENIYVEFVMVDNKSSDHTKEVIESFADKLPVRYLYEPKPGQNCARNRALKETQLGKLVVFTDDDIQPENIWLKNIIACSNRWPDYSIFGGRIYPVWPSEKIPKWANHKGIKEFAYAKHDFGCIEKPYKSNLPFSGNFWVRRKILMDNRRFDEQIGPQPGSYIMGSETIFLKRLAAEGYGMIYCPAAVVGHRITQKQLSIKYILTRAYQHGRGKARLESLCRAELFDTHPTIWRLVRLGSIARLFFLFIVSLIPLFFQKPEKSLIAMKWIGYNVESLRIAAETKKP